MVPAADGTSEAALPGNGTRIVFEPDADELPATATGQLDAIAASMMSDENVKVQVLAYASGSGDNESQARRKALSRGLEVRKRCLHAGQSPVRWHSRRWSSCLVRSPCARRRQSPALHRPDRTVSLRPGRRHRFAVRSIRGCVSRPG